MSAPPSPTRAPGRLSRRHWALMLLPLPASVALACWYFTAPLETSPPIAPAEEVAREAPADPIPAEEEAPAPLAWPEGRLEGDAAKRLLLDVLVAARDRLDEVPAYTATLIRRERVRGALGPEQTIALKVRHEPFSVYMRFVEPEAGKEAIYREGRYDGHVVGHGGGLSRRLIPRLKVPPDHPLALAANRHPITDAGIANLVRKLIGFREMDLQDEEAVTILDRVTDDEGRPRLRSVHSHPHYRPERPFAYVEVLYDPDTFLPVKITNFDWPGPDHEGDLDLAETYAYEDLDLEAVLEEEDFDPANPEYEFSRF